jgi:hypothetical protein
MIGNGVNGTVRGSPETRKIGTGLQAEAAGHAQHEAKGISPARVGDMLDIGQQIAAIHVESMISFRYYAIEKTYE